MYFAYGTYRHPTDEVALTDATIQRQYNRRGLRTHLRHTWQLRGTLIPASATPAAVTAAVAALKNAYAVDGQNAGLFEDDGTPTTYFFNSAQALGGVKVVAGPSLPEGAGASYVTYLRYTITLQADFPDPVENLDYYQEQISFSGDCGPIRQWVTPISGPPQNQTIQSRSTQRITQSGSAVGFLARPTPANPLWPQLEHREKRKIVATSPDVNGRALTGYGVSWSYEFESPTNLSGIGPRSG